MQVQIEYYDDSEDDCMRTTFVGIDPESGKERLLAPCSLGSYYTYLEIVERAKAIWGEDVELIGLPNWLRKEP